LLVEDERTLARAIARGPAAEGLLTEVEHDGLAGVACALTGRTTWSCSASCCPD
jgi:hypothetical protein